MAQLVSYNGITYSIPSTGEVGWGSSLSSYLVALASGSLTLAGGNFPLQAEVAVGPNFGIASPYFRSGNANPALTGVVRLTNTESVVFRNASNTSDLPLYVQGNQLFFNGSAVGGGTSSPLTTKGDLYTYDLNNTRLPVGANGTVLTADSSSSTGLSWLPGGGGGGGGSVTGFTFTNANGVNGVVTSPTTTPTLTISLGAITPTSINASGTITASNFNGAMSGTHSGTSSGSNTGDQTITVTGAVTGVSTNSAGATSLVTTQTLVPIAKGGTGATTAVAAINALMPNQAGNNGKVAYTDGTNISWQTVGGGTGVSSVSTVNANGITSSVSNPTTTPTINLGLGNITPLSVAATGTVTGSNISGTVSGTNTGDQNIVLTGDATGSGTSNIAVALSNTAVTPGSYTRASVTVDAKGRVTAAASGALQTISLTGDVTGSGTASFATTLANSGVTAGTGYNTFDVNSKGLVVNASTASYLTANQNITVSGDATGSGTTALALTLANSGVSAGTYTNASITVDAKGRITSATNGGTSGTVTSVSVVNANGVSASISNPTTTPALTFTLGAINPTSITTGGQLLASGGGQLTNMLMFDQVQSYTAAGFLGTSGAGGSIPVAPTTVFSPNAGLSGLTARTYYQESASNFTIQRPITVPFSSSAYGGLIVGTVGAIYLKQYRFTYVLKNTTGATTLTINWAAFTQSLPNNSSCSLVWGNSGAPPTSIAGGRTVIVDIICQSVGTQSAFSNAAWVETFYGTGYTY